MRWQLLSLMTIKKCINSSFAPFHAYHNTKKVFSFRGLCLLTSDQGLCPWTPLVAVHSPHCVPPCPRCMLVLCACHMGLCAPNLYSWIRPYS